MQALRQSLIPEGYEAHPYRPMVPETYLDMLRSIVATYLFRETVEDLKQKGRDFSQYVYIPETDSITGETHHDRADHCHLLKRIAGTVHF